MVLSGGCGLKHPSGRQPGEVENSPVCRVGSGIPKFPAILPALQGAPRLRDGSEPGLFLPLSTPPVPLPRDACAPPQPVRPEKWG